MVAITSLIAKPDAKECSISEVAKVKHARIGNCSRTIFTSIRRGNKLVALEKKKKKKEEAGKPSILLQLTVLFLCFWLGHLFPISLSYGPWNKYKATSMTMAKAYA